MSDAQELADRYIAAWVERNSERRRERIAALWMPNGRHFVGERTVEGYDALESRVLESHQKWVADRGYRFRAVNNAQALKNSVTFNWEMLAPEGDAALAVGLEFLLLGEDGRIAADYQFIVKPPAG